VAPRWQPSLEDYIDIAAYLLGADRAAVERLPRLTLAESALHAPFASLGGVAAYPTLVEQAAVLLEHLARNHPLPDANKRAAFLLIARFLDANGLAWGRPNVAIDVGVVERVAAGDTTHDEVVDWIRERTRPKGDESPAIS
jgi:death-on-curing protein